MLLMYLRNFNVFSKEFKQKKNLLSKRLVVTTLFKSMLMLPLFLKKIKIQKNKKKSKYNKWVKGSKVKKKENEGPKKFYIARD